MNLSQRLGRDTALRKQLLALSHLTINYRWEQKNGKERAYTEILLGTEAGGGAKALRLQYQQVVHIPEQAQRILEEQAQELRRELRKYGAHYSPTSQGYYLYGERQESCFGKIE